MVKKRSESELMIDDKGDLYLIDRYAFKTQKTGTQVVTIQYAVPILKAKARDKTGKLKTVIQTPQVVQVYINYNLQAGQVHALELHLMIAPNVEEIGNLQMVNWGALSLKAIKTRIKPFQVLGFNNVRQIEDYWEYSGNQSADIKANIARFRPSRIEFGSSLSVTVRQEIIIDCRNGSNIQNISAIGPTVSKRQLTTLLTNGVEITRDVNNNPRYLIRPNISPGSSGKVTIEWRVNIPHGFQNTTDFGSMRSLKKVGQSHPKYGEYLQPGDYWPVDHPTIQDLIGKLPRKKSIFDFHRLLFEFVNRNLNYVITNNRQTALQALQTRQGDCSEFADLLVTLHRAVGIPSRVVEGIILENEKKTNPEFHAWVEFLTTKGWMQCDPTWGITTGITSQHIEFSHQKKGRQSSLYSIEYSGPRPEIRSQISWY